MTIDIKRVEDPRGEKERESLESKLDRQEALITYLAMMTDITLPEEEAGSDGRELGAQ